jgi:dolichol-phosphate mannosyltransferase
VQVLVVIPTYNESENIEGVLHKVRGALPEATVLVVDDGSPDGTGDMAEKVGSQIGSIEVLRRSEKGGLGSAYRAGFRWGLDRGFDVCVEMDADLSHDPDALPDLVAPLDDLGGQPRGGNRVELVIGSRYIPGGSIPKWAWHRRLLSRGGNVYASALLGLGVTDSTAGFRAYAATVLRRIALDDIRAEGYGFQIEMTYQTKRAGATIAEVPIRFVDRTKGESKMSTFIVVEAFGLVTWWGIQRILGIAGGRRRAPVGELRSR